MYTRLLTLLFLLVTCKAIAQNLPDVIPPTPNASSLAKYVEVPVSHYTGLPNINIPIYNITSKDIQVPISLSYHARGIKVEEIASNYGIGWSMNAGGVITRQIRWNPDDQTQGGYLGQSHYDGFWDTESVRYNAKQAELNNLFDRDPDQFIFNFLGFSGKFIYDRDTNEPILQSFDDIKIETFGSNPTDPTDFTNGIESFIVTDSKGTKYYFGKSSDGSDTARDKDYTETSFTYSYNGLTSTAATPSNKFTAWYLMEVVSPSRNKVNFTYEFEPTPIEYSTTYRKSQELYDKPGSGAGTKTAFFSKVRIYQQKIKKIEFDSGEVNFDYSFVRQDLDNSTALSSVEVLNEHNQRINKYVFDYFHSESTDGTSNMIYQLYQLDLKAKKRLFLNSVTQVGTNDALLPSYQFTYKDTNTLPNRFSTSHDKWGYYNGKNNGEFAVFTENLSDLAGRTIDTIKSQAGLLTKIEYPTGGWSEYEYESNRAVFPQKYVGHIAFGGNNPVDTKHLSLEKDPTAYDSITATYSIPFTVGPNLVINHPDGVHGTVLTSILLPYTTCTSQENSSCPYLVRIYNANGTLHGILHNGTPSSIITPGNYVLKVISNYPNTEDPYDFENSFAVTLSWDESVANETEVVFTGGSRIKRTTLDDGNGQTIVKNYEYKDSQGETSGRVFTLPPYYEYSEVVANGSTVLRLLKAVVGKPANTFTNEQGNHGGYSYVTEYFGDANNNHGKIEYEFTNFYNSGLFYKWPYHLPIDNEWLRGKPLEIRNYKNENGNYELVSKTKNTYEYGGIENGWGELTEIEFQANGSLPPNTRTKNFVKLAAANGIYDPNWTLQNKHNLFTTYYLTSGTLKLNKTKTFNYYDSEIVTDSVQYFYNYDKHYQLAASTNTTSDGESITTKMFYPDDIEYTNSLGADNLTVPEKAAIDKLKTDELHRVSEAIQTETYKDEDKNGVVSANELLSMQRTNYREWTSSLILPEYVQTALVSNTLDDRIQFLGYYSNGNVKEVKKTDGTPIVYIWGYNEQYPIAKIENATYSQVSGHVHNLQNLSNLDDDRTEGSIGKEGDLRDALTNLRNASELLGAMVTTYTYDPLIGVTSITDPRGYTTYYKYDAFNRLQEVKDANGNMISDNTYHYKGQ